MTDSEISHDDLREILLALGLGDHARPYSPHEVVQREVLPAIRRTRYALTEIRDALIDWDEPAARDVLFPSPNTGAVDHRIVPPNPGVPSKAGAPRPEPQVRLPALAWVEKLKLGKILDPDGWRHDDGVTLDTPITRDDFERRYAKSTIDAFPDRVTVPRADEEAQEPRCQRCGSPKWVSVSFNGGYTRVAQCVPCGAIHAVGVIGPGWQHPRFNDLDAILPAYR